MGTASDCRLASRSRLQDARLSLTSNAQVVSTSEMSCSQVGLAPWEIRGTAAGRKQQDSLVQNAS